MQRRRTQMRLAQRAYRHRKDTAITTLEQRVRELERTNDDMSKEFSKFYDLLHSERILDAAPNTSQRESSRRLTRLGMALEMAATPMIVTNFQYLVLETATSFPPCPPHQPCRTIHPQPLYLPTADFINMQCSSLAPYVHLTRLK